MGIRVVDARDKALRTEIVWMKEAIDAAPVGSLLLQCLIDLLENCWGNTQLFALARAAQPGVDTADRAAALSAIEAYARNKRSLIAALLDHGDCEVRAACSTSGRL